MKEKALKAILTLTKASLLDPYIAEEIVNVILSKQLNKSEDIAIIGIGGRLPGVEGGIASFWESVTSGHDFIRKLPLNRRKDLNPYYNHELPNEELFWDAAYLENISDFDAEFFGIPAAEAERMDPSHRIFLEIVSEAIQEAGIEAQFYQSKTGIFVGNPAGDYGELFDDIDPHLVTGTLDPFFASRVSYLYDLKGPAFSVQSTCSSSFVALHQAILSLQSGDCDLAVVGGATVYCLPERSKKNFTTASGIISAEHHCRPFDRNASGIGRGEAVLAFILKRFSDAQKDKDIIRAIIRSSAINNDGKTMGISAPSVQAQSAVIVDAWKKAGINPKELAYIECHGTGTQLGDPIEIKAITEAFAHFIPDYRQGCGIGSLKGNIGHLVDGTAGLSSLLKIVLSFEHRTIPATLHLSYPNENINFIDSPVYPVNRLIRLNTKDPLLGGVSCFSFNGTNVHVVVEAAERDVYIPTLEKSGEQLFSFSAPSKTRLIAFLKRFISVRVEGDARDIAGSLARGRRIFSVRFAVIARAHEMLLQEIAHFINCNQVDDFPGYANLSQLKASDDKPIIITSVQDGLHKYLNFKNISFKTLYESGSFRKVSIPALPFERRRYWKISHAKLPNLNPLGAAADNIESLWQKHLGTDVSYEGSFFELGGTSLSAMAFLSDVERHIGISVSLGEFLVRPYLSIFNRSDVKHSDPISLRHNSPININMKQYLTPEQKSFLFLYESESEKGKPFYHVEKILEIEGLLEEERLLLALKKLMKRHDLLQAFLQRGEKEDFRMLFSPDGLVPYRKIDISFYSSNKREAEALRIAKKEFLRPFQFNHEEVLWRITYIPITDQRSLLVIVHHHVISDLYSMDLFLNELNNLYLNASSLDTPTRYIDYILKREDCPVRQNLLEDYWKNKLTNYPPPPVLFVQQPTTEQTASVHNEASVQIEPDTLQKLLVTATELKATPYVVICGLYSIFISKFQAKKEVVVGIETANRDRADTRSVIGPLVNQLLLRTQLSADESLRSNFYKVKAAYEESLSHSDYPFCKVVGLLLKSSIDSALPTPYDLVRHKVLTNSFETLQKDFCGFPSRNMEYSYVHTMFDTVLRFNFSLLSASLALTYRDGYLTPRIAERILQNFHILLVRFLSDPDIPFSQLEGIILSSHAPAELSNKITGFRKSRVSVSKKPEVILQDLGSDSSFPLLVQSEDILLSLPNWIKKERELVRKIMLERGAVLFRGFIIKDHSEFAEVAKSIHPVIAEYVEPSTPRDEYQDKVYTSSLYPAYHKIQLHTELSYTYHWPMKGLFWCKLPSLTGGESPLGDNREVTARLSGTLRDKFLQKGVLYQRNYGDGILVPWQKVFKTEDPKEVEAYCNANYPMQFEWLPEGRLRTFQKRDAFLFHPITQELCWFNQSHIFHIRSLGPQIQADLLDQFSPKELPVHAYFGDGSPITDCEMDEILSVLEACEYKFPYKQNDVLAFDNVLLSHGRNAYEGSREVLAIFIEPGREA